MKALSLEGQQLIESNQIWGFFKRTATINLIKDCLDAVKLGDVAVAKENACKAYELISDATKHTFIVVNGLVALVINENPTWGQVLHYRIVGVYAVM